MSCKDCTKREIGCHGWCEDYIAETKAREERKAIIWKEKGIDVAFDERTASRIEKARRRIK